MFFDVTQNGMILSTDFEPFQASTGGPNAIPDDWDEHAQKPRQGNLAYVNVGPYIVHI